MPYMISLALLMALLWLGLSGLFKPVVLALGVASIVLAVWLARRMDVVGVEHNPVLFSWRLPLYWAWLIREIIVANLNVARLVLSPRRIEPRVIHVPVPHRSAVAKVAYANSVTLTPGTVSLHLSRDELTVHALDAQSAAGIESGDMAHRIQWLEAGRETSEKT